jgi:hypothetical protein
MLAPGAVWSIAVHTSMGLHTMSSLFDSVFAAAAAVTDTVMGDIEGFAFVPMKGRSDADPVPDLDRPTYAKFDAVFRGPARLDRDTGFARETLAPELRVLRYKFPAGIKNGDRITRLATGELFKVTNVALDTRGVRMIVSLQRVQAR